MEQELLKEFQAKKAKLIEVTSQAKANGWIDEAKEKAIIDKINNDTLTIGVIGQMKCGKSTFLNAFLFGDTVLPSATTPMTATLSVITYGPEKKLEAEFYTSEEWEEQKYQATRNLDELRGNEMEESKVKAAKELVSKAVNIPGSVNDYLGTKRSDTFDNLQEYVGADGKYVAITKSVTLYMPFEYLKGVEVVDTPGFNDPIVSREERTKEFLRKADVVLLMLYAGRPFDATDRTILFKNVRECGIGKILIGLNKYDLPYHNGETEQEMIVTVKEQIAKACATSGDESMVELVKENDPILLSAEMALMSQLPLSRTTTEFATSWERACNDFEISTQSQMKEKSRIANLTDAIKNIIEQDKLDVLIRKPYNAIRGAALAKKEILETELQQTKTLITNLGMPDDELEEKLAKLQKAKRKLNRKLDSLGDDISLAYSNIIRKGRRDMEDEVDAACKKLDLAADNLRRLADEDDFTPTWNSTINILCDRTLKRTVERMTDDAKRELNKCVRGFCEEAEDVLLRHVEDFDSRDFMKKISLYISEEIENRGVCGSNESEASDGEKENTLSFLERMGIIILSPLLGVGLIGDKIGKAIFGNGDVKRNLHDKIEELRNSFDPDGFLDSFTTRKDSIIELVKEKIMGDLITPLQKQLEEILSGTQDKEKQLAEARQKETELEASLCKVQTAFDSIFGK